MIIQLGDTREESLIIEGVENETIEFNGVLISQTNGEEAMPDPRHTTNKWPRTRAHIIFKNCRNIEIINPSVYGPNAKGGSTNAGYNPAYEGQHALEIYDCENVYVKSLTASHVWGDGIYCRRVKNATFKDCHIHHQGRQGTTIIDSHNITLDALHQHDIRRSHIDIENNSIDEVVDGVTIQNGKFGKSRLNFIANLGKGIVRNVYVLDNDLYFDDFNIHVQARSGVRENFVITGNRSATGRGGPLEAITIFEGVDGLVMYNNDIAAQPGRNMHIMGVKGGRNIFLGENKVPGGLNEIKYFSEDQVL